MQKQYEKHKSVMDLLAVFESHTSSKSLQFSKQFGVDQIHDVQILEEESEEDLPRTTEAIISGESVDNYKFCESNIPLKLNPQEYTIYSSVEILLKKTMRNKRHQLDHQKVLDKFEEISLVIRQLVEYFLQNPGHSSVPINRSNAEFFEDEHTNVADSHTTPQVELPPGGKDGVFMASVLDSLWKVVLLNIDDVLLFQKDMIRDKVREKFSYLTFDKKNYEMTIHDLKNQINDLKKKFVKTVEKMDLQLKNANKEKFDELKDPEKRSEVISDAMENYEKMASLLDTVENEKDIQINAVNDLISMYKLGTNQGWEKPAKINIDFGMQTEPERAISKQKSHQTLPIGEL